LASILKASKSGALSAGITDLSSEPGLLNTLGATFFSELHAIYVVEPLDWAIWFEILRFHLENFNDLEQKIDNKYSDLRE